LFGSLGFARGDIQAPPAIAIVMLGAGCLVFVLPLLMATSLSLSDPPSIGWLSRACGLISALLGIAALWQIRGPQFR